ncbi:sigma-70 family RNA polymerase sigma factor [Fodinisporobacter ferrooxydans]|uniref:Sigma-70 family RNA polymerase sigma factor n=1 Tax=Fodinisporobacter ferrooxydans TaxID=2901836 RepID=A0ABY4CNZ9_9BACL|nr:sigma-70 family RNA polymerase sigma factor [Alicyclobacillaceae bacterium MYW30-H2]
MVSVVIDMFKGKDKKNILNDLVMEYGDTVLQLAFFYLHDKGLAEDAFQEVFIKVYNHLENFRGDSSLKTWICKITANVCRDRVRSWSFRNLLYYGDDTVYSTIDNHYADDSDLHGFDREQVLEAILNLPVPLREVIVLYYYKDFDTKEIASILKISEGTVRSRMHRAREKLKKTLEEGGVQFEAKASR